MLGCAERAEPRGTFFIFYIWTLGVTEATRLWRASFARTQAEPPGTRARATSIPIKHCSAGFPACPNDFEMSWKGHGAGWKPALQCFIGIHTNELRPSGSATVWPHLRWGRGASRAPLRAKTGRMTDKKICVKSCPHLRPEGPAERKLSHPVLREMEFF